MQYFTFIGTGKYDKIKYSFQEGQKPELETKYVQEAIVNGFNEEIDEIFIFCTVESREAHGIILKRRLEEQYHKKVHFIVVSFDVQTEEIVLEMNKVLKEDFIIDITHSFRNIPIAVTLITRYLEYSKGYHLKHLYYGNSSNRLIIDMLKQYQNMQLVNELESFDKYLKVSKVSLSKYESSKEIDDLLLVFAEFNRMIEFCEFDKSIDKIRRITELSRGILKDKNYILIHPYLERIIMKFESVNGNKRKSLKKIALIQILLQHRLYQIAITFTDQLIREELVHYIYFPKLPDFNKQLVDQLLRYPKRKDTYNLSTDILKFYEIHGKRERIDKYSEVERYINKNGSVETSEKIRKLKNDKIDKFYSSIRNHINHGEEIEEINDVENIVNDCLNLLTNFIKEQ